MSDQTLTAETLLTRIRTDGLRRVSAAFRKPPIPSRILQELVALPDAPEALEFVAAYPLSPSHLLEALAHANPPPSVLAHLATNPRTPPHLLIEFTAHEDPIVRAQAATHPQLPGRELFTLAGDSSPVVRRALAGNHALRLPHQAKLIADEDPAVRLRLAGQPGLPLPVALVLGADTCAVVRLHTVATAAAEDNLLEGWAAGDEEDIQLALLQRKNLPTEICHSLVRSIHPSVRRLARTDLDLDDVDLLFLASRGETDERAWVAGRPLIPRPLQSLLARDADVTVRTALAANPALDESIARYFMSLAEAPVCQALAGNPTLPPDLIEELAATRLPEVLAALAYREDIDPTLAQFLLVHSPDFCRHWAMQGRTDATIDTESAKRLFKDSLPTLRVLAITACPDWRRADLYDLARDPSPNVRIAAVRHPNAPDELVQDRVNDSSPEVAAAARDVQTARKAKPSRIVLDARSTHTSIDVKPTRPTLTDPQSASTTEPPAAIPSAPEIFNKLKRIFWQ